MTCCNNEEISKNETEYIMIYNIIPTVSITVMFSLKKKMALRRKLPTSIKLTSTSIRLRSKWP